MAKSGSNKIAPPKGTRDLYPQDLLRQRYITEAWRRVSIRHGFDEIAGPTFEMLDLYKKKSGEGIVSELFSFTRTGGDDHYALRPEFTPTLARMYAEKAKELPTPCKWFTAGPYFRAEKPQRGRLREFLQWNCDVMGGEAAAHDAEIISVVNAAMESVGLAEAIKTVLNDRGVIRQIFMNLIVHSDRYDEAYSLLDMREKMSASEYDELCADRGLAMIDTERLDGEFKDVEKLFSHGSFAAGGSIGVCGDMRSERYDMRPLRTALSQSNVIDRCRFDPTLTRGLAYYTGTVFELIADGERAIAGGGRYDNLIELFGGKPTPAVGFGMGDVVLGLLLEDKGLMPEGPDLADAVSQKPASIRPEAFVIANEEGEAQVEPLLAELRRGTEREGFDGKPWDAKRYSVQPMHARRSYKSTKNIGKLLADARKQHAKFAVIIENDSQAKIENLTTREEVGTFDLKKIGAELAEHL